MPTQTTATSAVAWSPDVQAIAPGDAVPDALILQTSTVAGAVEGDAPAVRCMYVDDDDAQFVAEGAEIPEADPDLAEVLVYTGKVSQLVRLSREQWTQPNANTLLSESVRRAVTRAANKAYLQQSPPSPPAVTPPAGLFHQATLHGGIDGGNLQGNLDALVDIQAAIADNGGNMSHILLSPRGWAEVRKIKDETQSARSLIGAGVEDAQPRLLNVPVIVTQALPDTNALAVDKTAIVSAAGPVLVARSQHVYFSSDSMGLRCTWRFGATVVHPNRIAFFTVTEDQG